MNIARRILILALLLTGCTLGLSRSSTAHAAGIPTTTTISAYSFVVQRCWCRDPARVFATFTVQNQGGGQPPPTGYVDVMVNAYFGQYFGQFPITPGSNGSATVTTDWGCFPIGSFVINAWYQGDALHQASTAATVTLTL
jgi:hypothetical protein